MSQWLDMFREASVQIDTPVQLGQKGSVSSDSDLTAPKNLTASAYVCGIAPRPTLDAEGLPVAPCPACGGRSFWRWPQSSPHHHPRAWFCIRCTPIPSNAGPCDACALPPVGSLAVDVLK